MGLKLNLGSGQNPRPGYVNVDKHGDPDLKCDLESFPWPWPDSSVSEILLIHVLEHLGASPDVFIRIMKEMYRVCEPAAQIYIVVPHPRHDNFIGDPTHVRPLTPAMMQLFSKKANLRWREIGSPRSPLERYSSKLCTCSEKRLGSSSSDEIRTAVSAAWARAEHTHRTCGYIVKLATVSGEDRGFRCDTHSRALSGRAITRIGVALVPRTCC